LKYCIGWIPQLIGDPSLTRRWEDVIYGRTNGQERVYFQVKWSRDKLDKDIPLEIDRISEGMRDRDKLVVGRIINTLKESIYIAQFRPIDDTNSKSRSLFVFVFDNNTLINLNSVYIFRGLQKSHQSDDVILLYRATICVNDLTKNGFLTLSIKELSPLIKNQDVATKQLFLETYQAIRDVLHCHTHHLSTSTHHHGNVPDSLIRPIFSDDPLDKKATIKIMNRYKGTLLDHTRCISDLLHKTEKRILPIRKGYSEISLSLKQAKGCLTYCLQLLEEISALGFINEVDRAMERRTLLNMKYAYQIFNEDLESRFQIDISTASEMILIITALFTSWIVFIEYDHDFTLPGYSIYVVGLITIIIVVCYVYQRYLKE
jgi:hypothetical protein